nr:hypothetical protein [Tanacetum cinerariifolium]
MKMMNTNTLCKPLCGDDDQEYDDEYAEETRDGESFDPIPQTPKNIDDEGNGDEDLGLNIGAAPPKPKASVRKTRSSSDTSITPSTVAASPRLTSSQKGKQAAKASKAKSLSTLSENSGTTRHDTKQETPRTQEIPKKQQSTKLLRVLVSGYQLDSGEHMVIPDIMPVHLVPPRNGRIL